MSQNPGPSLSLGPILEDLDQLDQNPSLVSNLSSTIGIQCIPTQTKPPTVPKPSLPESPDQAIERAQELVELDKQLKARAEEVEVRDVAGRLERTGKVLDELLRILEHASVVN
ncbi:hypothetical protein CROQUDRAFT_662646 [Cronartium quercuum f. sp. fusiforme G11]|uniref:Uncharacterized protein n=1 Tax=Cronartium quercuum f. sp. fusiforme G11 TaxID=708437 RepID=A0A9P6N9A5_9BASI|nr:hypothetical protein CROQUDRAFT_662646 [Cronartium quercuum f. sp. fusiforme G11]